MQNLYSFLVSEGANKSGFKNFGKGDRKPQLRKGEGVETEASVLKTVIFAYFSYICKITDESGGWGPMGTP